MSRGAVVCRSADCAALPRAGSAGCQSSRASSATRRFSCPLLYKSCSSTISLPGCALRLCASSSWPAVSFDPKAMLCARRDARFCQGGLWGRWFHNTAPHTHSSGAPPPATPRARHVTTGRARSGLGAPTGVAHEQLPPPPLRGPVCYRFFRGLAPRFPSPSAPFLAPSPRSAAAWFTGTGPGTSSTSTSLRRTRPPRRLTPEGEGERRVRSATRLVARSPRHPPLSLKGLSGPRSAPHGAAGPPRKRTGREWGRAAGGGGAARFRGACSWFRKGPSRSAHTNVTNTLSTLPPAAAGWGLGRETGGGIRDGWHVDYWVPGLGCAPTAPTRTSRLRPATLPGSQCSSTDLKSPRVRSLPGALLAKRLSERGMIVAALDYRNFPQARNQFLFCHVSPRRTHVPFWCAPSTLCGIDVACSCASLQGTVSDMTLDVSTGIAYVMHNCEMWGGDPKR